MSFKRYTRYTSSGVCWIGDVPKHWSVKRLGYYFSERREKVSDSDYPPLSVTQYGVVPQLENVAKTDNRDNRKKVCKGDLVINSRSDRMGSSGLAYQDGSVSLVNTVLVPRGDIEPLYAHYLFKSTMFQQEFYRLGKGIVDDLWTTHYSEMKNILVPMPSIMEQQSIASFLDHQTAKLDQLIEKKQRLIELLQEYRQALITQAVTKGLDPNVPMKDSGIPWLGEVPAHWKLSRLKYFVWLNPPKGEVRHLADDTLVTFLPMEAVSESGRIDGSRIMALSDCISGYTYFARNDVLLAKITPCFENGKSALVSDIATDIGFGSTEFHVIRAKDNTSPRYLAYLVRSKYFRTFGEASMIGAAGQKRVPEDFIANYRQAFPPKSEQEEIADYLDRNNEVIERLISRIETQIAVLHEYRQALITAAVTGQIDVREWAGEKSETDIECSASA